MSERQMNCVDQVTQATNAREATLALAAALDRILEHLEHPLVAVPSDPWAVEWPHDGQGGRPDWRDEEAHKQVHHDYAQQIAALQEQLAAATGEDAQALQAQLNLLKDAAGEKVYDTVGGIRESTPDGKRVQAEGDDVVSQPASPGRKMARAKWAEDVKLEEYLPLFAWAHEAHDAFARGGPMWLYEGNRDAIMQMPYEARVFLVKDVALDSEAQAQELGRDILKSPTSADQQITTDAILDGAVGGRG